jgi:uncharacterized coiled-coil protein SlyX
MNKRSVVSFIVVAVVLFGGYFAWANRYNVSDWLILNSYTPPAEIKKMAEDSGMNTYGKRLFYVKMPELSSREEFNTQCTNKEETIVLGCYTGTNIYIFDVEDESLNGAEEVTAAHEMLHAAYDRLSEREKKRVDELTAEAVSRLNNKRLNEIIKAYASEDPSVVPNELHSILGTEERNLGPELEQYYKKYFDNRLAIVEIAEKYQKVFDDIEKKIDRYDARLSLLNAQISTQEKELASLNSRVQVQRAELDRLLANGDNASYNALVPGFNANADSFNAQLASLQDSIAEYNKIVEERNKISVKQQDLADSIDSRLKPIE